MLLLKILFVNQEGFAFISHESLGYSVIGESLSMKMVVIDEVAMIFTHSCSIGNYLLVKIDYLVLVRDVVHLLLLVSLLLRVNDLKPRE